MEDIQDDQNNVLEMEIAYAVVQKEYNQFRKI